MTDKKQVKDLLNSVYGITHVYTIPITDFALNAKTKISALIL